MRTFKTEEEVIADEKRQVLAKKKSNYTVRSKTCKRCCYADSNIKDCLKNDHRTHLSGTCDDFKTELEELEERASNLFYLKGCYFHSEIEGVNQADK